MEVGNLHQAGYEMMIDARFVFLLLTASLLATLIAIAVATLNKKRKQKLEEPKHRMLEDD
jgi:hypothetical protein